MNKKYIREKVNEEYVITLIKNSNTKLIDVENINIVQYYNDEIRRLEKVLDNSNTDLNDLYIFFKDYNGLDEIDGYYDYCEHLTSAFQSSVSAYPKDVASKIIDRISEIDEVVNEKNKAIDIAYKPDDKDEKNKLNNKAERLMYENELAKITKQKIQLIESYKAMLKKEFILWVKAYSIKQTYKMIQSKKKDIIAYSHRIGGWSNPAYKLTENFSLEIKTNFGYGRSSYFYLLLTFKNIPIAPFSDWIYYRNVDAYEIIKYSKSYPLNDEYWVDAMSYSKEACNLSLTDEVKFVQIYLLEECEKMVNGLEDILVTKKMTFKRFGTNELYDIEFNTTHLIVLFRAEKISGSLDFISKIKEYNELISISSFIRRIEKLNEDFKPVIDEEIKKSSLKLSELKKQLKDSDAETPKFVEKSKIFDEKRNKIKEKMESNGTYDPKKVPLIEELKKVHKAFDKKYPEYQKFDLHFTDHVVKNSELRTKYSDCDKNLERIVSYNEKIEEYFKTK
jgi:hypothetical protein